MPGHAVRWSAVRSAVVASAAVPLALGGCAGDSGTAPARSPVVVDGTVRIATPSEVPSFNPYSQFGAGLARYAYDSLVNVTPRGDVVSGLAARWHADATSATFTLRRDVTCSDGTALTAAGVARALAYASDPRNRLIGARGALPAAPFTVAADDRARTVTVRMSAPYSFISRTIGLLPVVCPAGLGHPASLDRGTDGTGPYVLSSYTPGGPYVFTARAGYHWGPAGATGGAAGQPARLVVSVVPDESTAANLLLTGGVNVATVTGPDRARLAGHGLTTLDVPTVLGLAFFNERAGRPLGDRALRRALVATLDRKGLANVAMGGDGTPATDLTAANAVCHADLTAAQLPASDAPRALRAAGWRKDRHGRLAKDGRPLHIRLLTAAAGGSTLPSVGELMADTWAPLGVDVELVSESLNALVKAMYQDADFDVVIGSSPGLPLPAQLIPSFSGPAPPAGLNFAGIRNTPYDRLVARALGEPDTSGCGTWQRAAAALLRSADALPVADGSSTVYGYRTTLAVGFGGQVVPTSIRLHR